MRRVVPLIGLSGAIATCAVAVQISAAQAVADREIEPALMSINASDMMRHIEMLASDEFEGRGPGTRGEELTVAYLIGQFKRLGLKPGNPDGTYVQRVPFVGSKAKSTLSFSVAGKLMELKEPDDFWAGSLWQVPEINIQNSDLIFVGHGVVAPEYDWDDFKNVDVKGKTLVMLPNDPQVPDPNDATKLDPNLFKGRTVTFYSHGDHKREVAKLRGAVARITIFDPGMFGTRTWKDRVSIFGTEEFDTREADKKRQELGAGGEIRPEVALQLFSASGHDLAALKKAAQRRDFRPVPLNATASFRITQTLRELESSNVVALVEGSDPQLKNEYVIYTAHWDHFGRDQSLQGDQIFNGARDNASGVAALLEVAKAFARLKTPPKRSVLFIATTGEEHGLLGAKYYAAHPLYPLERTLANLNIDGTNVWGPTRDVSIIGYGKSTLADTLDRLIQGHGRKGTDDLLPEFGLFYRSDHFEFAKQGVPAVWMRRGLDVIGKPEGWGKQETDDYFANHYHKVSDEIKPGWDLTGAVEDYRLYFELGYRIAQDKQWPEWKPGDEFKAKRDTMLKKGGP